MEKLSPLLTLGAATPLINSPSKICFRLFDMINDLRLPGINLVEHILLGYIAVFRTGDSMQTMLRQNRKSE
jgi:hypothetical protein